MTLLHAFVMVLINILLAILVGCLSVLLMLSPILVFVVGVIKLGEWVGKEKRVKHMNKRDKERCNCNKTDILLYDRDKVTLEDCIIMQEKYGLSAVVSSGELLGFESEQ